MLARDRMTLNDMSWLLIKVFFGYALEPVICVLRSRLTGSTDRAIWASTWLSRYAIYAFQSRHHQLISLR